ncbi:leucine--tRNA ligase [Candidatus Woesearchaeota archaeon]|nr:leucine--tRNA ligase [Candidatus Woesearchaeota archaeon]
MVNWKKIQEKWNKRWEKEKIFEAVPEKGKKKFFGTFPYPYINLYPHIGHFYSLMRLEALARFKRMRGYKVLYPQAWHCTGSPIVNAANRVKEGEEQQIQVLKNMGFSEEEISKFEKPRHWIDVFSEGWEQDLKEAGCSIDWRRNFITTSLNSHYNKFIEWQFRSLKKKGLVEKGKKPVVWCPKCNQAIGDHARVGGEGETPQEYTLLKFKFEDSFIICASLRPETIYGQTNIWVDPDAAYVKVKVNGKENWICSRQCAEKLKLQDKKIEIVDKVPAAEMIGKYAHAPGIDKEIIILPSYFCDPNIGTGIVTSVPSDAPDDYIGLRDLKENKDLAEKFGLNWEDIKKIEVIPIIETEEWGDAAAVKIVEDWNIKNQHEREKLEKARKIVYKAGYHTGNMNKNCGPYAGMPVEKAKEKMKKSLLQKGKADLMYEPTGKVICRCLSEAKIKIVSDQWFLVYGQEDWKQKAHECLDSMDLYPEKVRSQFEYVLDWLNDWACTHESESELGTPLPWDKKWVIESLSDSTIYMAYYTIAHKIKDIPKDKIDDRFFDYVFLGKGDKKDIPVKKEILEELREEFLYWYPMDFRNSGKDLIQNHMAFSIFNHTAIFPKKHWPRSFGLNGWVTVDSKKMSKSLGNVIPVREMVRDFGSDASRFTVLSGGEGLDDANWDTELARTMRDKLKGILGFAKANYDKGIYEKRTIDKWMEAQLNQIIKETTGYYEKTLYRSVIQKAYFDLQRVIKWYQRRTADSPNKEVMNRVIETQLLLMAPITPFIAEETWEAIGKKGLISTADWPESDKKINQDLIVLEDIIETTLNDIHSVLKITGIKKPKKITLFTAPGWKYKLFKKLKKVLEKTRKFSDIMKEVMKDGTIKKHGKDATKIIQKLIKTGKSVEKSTSEKAEFIAVKEARDFFSKEFYDAEIVVNTADESKHKKANQAMPNKPAILVE